MREIRLRAGFDRDSFKADNITAEEFESWSNLPVTKKMVNIIKSVRDSFADSLYVGGTLCGDGAKTVEATAKAVGVLYGADLFLEAKYEESEEDDER